MLLPFFLYQHSVSFKNKLIRELEKDLRGQNIVWMTESDYKYHFTNQMAFDITVLNKAKVWEISLLTAINHLPLCTLLDILTH